MRWGLGPVFLYECVASSRRWQTYAVRSVGVVILLAALATIANSRRSMDPVNTWREYAALGQSYFYAIIGVELTLVLLAAPAATAGAICVDRARGTLTHVLATDLSDPEIVLGKLGARLLPVLGLVACTWPVLAISSLLGGIDPTALTLAFAIILAVALLGCTMALALSVWARKPHEVVLVTYTFWMVVLLIWPIGYAASLGRWATGFAHWCLVADPYFLAFARYNAPNQVDLWDYVAFWAVALGLSAGFIMLAVRRMRPVACRGTGDRRKEPTLGLVGRLTRWLPGPSLDRNPVLWREWHRTRPSRWLTILIALIGGLTGIACLVGAVLIWVHGLDDFRNATGFIAGTFGYMIQLIFGLLMLSAVAPTSMAEERQRGSLDLLATTTLSTRSIVLGKWLGTLRFVPLLALGPGLLGLAMATAHKTPLAVTLAGLRANSLEEMSRVELIFGAVPPGRDDRRPRCAHRERRRGAGRLDQAAEPGDRRQRGIRRDDERRLAGPGGSRPAGRGDDVPESHHGRRSPRRDPDGAPSSTGVSPRVDRLLGHRVPRAGHGIALADGPDVRPMHRPDSRTAATDAGAI